MKKLIGISIFFAVVLLNIVLNVTNTKSEIGLSFFENQAIAGGCELSTLWGNCYFKCDEDEESTCSYENQGVTFECQNALEVDC